MLAILVTVIMLLGTTATAAFASNWPVIKSGSRGTEAYATQKLLQYRGYNIGSANPDGIVGANTVAAIKKFQTDNKLTVDGAAGTNTLSKLVATVQSGSNNGAVYALQYLLKNKFGQNIAVDGVFGSGTLAGVKAFQSALGITADGTGTVGQNTWRELFGASARTIPIPVASLTSAPLADGTYTIQGKTSGKVVDINGASRDNGATAHIWPANSGDNQKFVFARLSDGTYKITALHSQKSLEVRNSSLSDGADVAQWDYDANYACKRWYVVDGGDGYYKFINKNSGKALDVNGNGTADGTNLQQWTDNGTDAQRFRLIPVVKATSNIAISGFTAPTSLTKGQAYSIAGTVSSNNKITKVTISVGSEISVSATPNATSYSLKGLDSSVKFGSLSAGTKTLTITVTDTVASKPFTYSFVVTPVPTPTTKEWSIKIELPKDRTKTGVLYLYDSAGAIIQKSDCYGKSAYNKEMWEYQGNTPTGTYTGQLGPVQTNNVTSYGPYQVVMLTGGDYASARSGIWIHGGQSQTKLSATLGCVRIFNADQKLLQDNIKKLIASGYKPVGKVQIIEK
jgi:peptidoglycan hydrolase-like protein with peptidoglycan-binding domain